MTLLPCPFCGSQPFIEETDPEFEDMFPYRIMCVDDDCAGGHSWADSEEAAIKAWNTRAGGWIPVSERLPEPGTFIVACSKHGIDAGVCENVKFLEKNYIYWHELPTPPEDE